MKRYIILLFVIFTALATFLGRADMANAQSWTDLNSAAGAGTTLLYQSAIGPSGQMIVVGASGYIRTSTDGGVSWTDRKTAAGSGTTGLRSAAIGPSGEMIVVGNSGYIRTSTDGGVSWTDRKTAAGAGTTQLNGAAIGPSGEMIVVGNSGYIRTSTDGGASWIDRNSVVGAGTTGLQKAAIGPSGQIIVVGNSGFIKGADSSGASSWGFIAAGAGTTQLWAAAIGPSGQVLVVGNGFIKTNPFGLWASGDNWSDRNSVAGVGSTGLNGAAIGPSGQMIVVGASGYIRTSTDGGASWTDQNSAAGAGTIVLAYPAIGPLGQMIAVGQSGFIKVKAPVSVTTTGYGTVSYNGVWVNGTFTNNTTNNVYIGAKFGAGEGYSSTACQDLPGTQQGGLWPPGTTGANSSWAGVLNSSTLYYACLYAYDPNTATYYYSSSTIPFTTSAAPAPVYNYSEQTAIDSTSALVGISVNPYGITPTVTVRWGAGAGYSGTACSSLPQSASVSNPSGAQFDQGYYIPYSYRITGLTPGQPFYWCYQVTASGTNTSTKYNNTALATSTNACDLLPGSVAGATEKSRLATMLGSSNLKGTLLYKGTVNGWTTANFHTAVDNQGENVVIVRNSGNNHIIGAYMPSSWTSAGAYATGSNPFIFSLTNNYKLRPLTGSHIAYLHSTVGPYMGSQNDFRNVQNPMNGASAFGTLSSGSYESPSSKGAYTYLNGSGGWTFTTNEIEVYALSACTTSEPVLESTPSQTGKTSTTITLGGNVTSNGGAALLAKGVCYSLTSQDSDPGFTTAGGSTPEPNVTCVNHADTSTGTYTIPEVQGLSPDTSYSFRAFARNSVGNGYSNVGSFTTLTNTPTGVTTNPEANLGSYKLTFNGTANPNGSQAYGYFRYFTSAPDCTVDSGGTRVPTFSSQDYNLGSGSSPVNFSINTPSDIFLVPNTPYWYCAYARNVAAGAGSPGTSAAAGYRAFTTLDGQANPCDAPASGDLTITENCAFSETSDGVDAGGGGTSNTARIAISGAKITLAFGQRIARGSFSITNGGGLLVSNGGGGFIRAGVWYKDSDGDGVLDQPIVKTVSDTQPEGYVRRNHLYQQPLYNNSTFAYASKFNNAETTAPTYLDCDSTNGNLFQNVANLVKDQDQDRYKTSAAAAQQCVGDTQVAANGRTYYKDSAGAYTWLASADTLGSGATDCQDDPNGAPCAPVNSSGTNGTNPGAAAASTTQINLSWGVNTNGGAVPATTGYDVHICGLNDTTCATIDNTVSVSSATFSYNNSSLTCSTSPSYYYRLVAKSGNGNTNSNIFSGVTSTCCTNGYQDNDGDGVGQATYGCYTGTVVQVPAPAVKLVPGTAANDASIGTIATSPTTANLAAADGVTDSILSGSHSTGTISNYAKYTNWGFSIPTDATIRGVIAEVRAVTDGGGFYAGNRWEAVRLVKGGTVSGNNLASDASLPISTEGLKYVAFGGSTNLGGVAFTPADINSTGFGVAVAIEKGYTPYAGYIDNIRLKVFYTGGTPAASGDYNDSDSSCYANLGTMYLDVDGDTYTAGSVANVCIGGATTTGNVGRRSSASGQTDCYDGNASAKPGQTLYFDQPRGDGHPTLSYDYNCNDGVEVEQTAYDCCTTANPYGYDTQDGSGYANDSCTGTVYSINQTCFSTNVTSSFACNSSASYCGKRRVGVGYYPYNYWTPQGGAEGVSCPSLLVRGISGYVACK